MPPRDREVESGRGDDEVVPRPGARVAGGSPYPADVLAAVRARCEARPDAERCGFVLRRRDGALEVVEVENALAAAEAGAEEARGRYVMDPAAVLQVLLRVDREGGDIAAVWHSHVDAPAVLSARDRAEALVGGRPALPGAEQLVVSVVEGRVAEVRRYVPAEGGYVEAGAVG